MPKKKLDLLQLASSRVTESSTCPAQVMRDEPFDRVSLDGNNLFGHAIPGEYKILFSLPDDSLVRPNPAESF